jgi:hypothetical protein
LFQAWLSAGLSAQPPRQRPEPPTDPSGGKSELGFDAAISTIFSSVSLRFRGKPRLARRFPDCWLRWLDIPDGESIFISDISVV